MDPNKALNIIAGMCSNKEYCSRSIREKLEKWEIPEKEIERILAFLYKNKFIDDSRYAFSYANDKFRFNKWGKQKIAMMLKQKGISSDIITAALSNLSDENYDETCLYLLRQKLKTIKEGDPNKTKARLIRFALSRGFDFDTIYRCMPGLSD